MCSNTLVQKIAFILWKRVPHAHGTKSSFWVRWSSLVHRRNARNLGETDCVTVACLTGRQTVDLIIRWTWPTTKYRGVPSTLVLGCFTAVASCKTLTGKMFGSDLDPEPLETSDFWATRTYVDHMLQCNKFGTSSFNYLWNGNHGNNASSDAPALDASRTQMSLPSLIAISYWHLIDILFPSFSSCAFNQCSQMPPVYPLFSQVDKNRLTCSTWFWLMWYLLGLATAPFQPMSFPGSGVCSPSYQVWTVKRLLEKIKPRCPTIFWKTHHMQASLLASYCFPRIIGVELKHVSKELQRDKESVPSVP